MAIIKDLIKNMSKEERNKIIRVNQDMLEGLVWERNLEYEVNQWYGGASNKKKCIVFPDKTTLKNPNDNKINTKLDHSPMNELQEEVRSKYIGEKNQKNLENSKLSERVFDMEYLLGKNSGFSALRNKTLNNFMDKK